MSSGAFRVMVLLAALGFNVTFLVFILFYLNSGVGRVLLQVLVQWLACFIE